MAALRAPTFNSFVQYYFLKIDRRLLTKKQTGLGGTLSWFAVGNGALCNKLTND